MILVLLHFEIYNVFIEPTHAVVNTHITEPACWLPVREVFSPFRVGSSTISAILKAGFHLYEFGRTIARPVVWACVVRFTEEDSPVFGVRATDFGSWIDFNFSATSTNRANQIAFILQ